MENLFASSLSCSSSCAECKACSLHKQSVRLCSLHKFSQRHTVTMNTHTAIPQVLWELEGGGAEQHYFHLEGGKKFPTYRSQQTYAGHSWIVRRAGEILLRFTARNEPTMVCIPPCVHPSRFDGATKTVVSFHIILVLPTIAQICCIL